MARAGTGRGQSLVELALLMPVFLVLALGAVDFARAYASALTASNAARQAVMYATQHQADGSSSGGTCNKPWGQTIDVAMAAGTSLGLTCSSVAVVTGSADPYGRTPVTVTVTSTYQPLTPLASNPLGLRRVVGTATARGETW